MSSTPRLKLADNGVWYVHWLEGRREKRISTRTKDVAAAKAFLGTWLLMEQEAPRAPEQTYTVADLWLVYDRKHLETAVESPETPRSSWLNLEPHFGAKTLAEVTQDLVDAYVAKRAAGRIGRPAKPSTVRRELTALQAALNFAAAPKRKLIPPGAVPVFDLPPSAEPRDRWLQHDEIQRLLAAASEFRRDGRLHRGERFLWLALETGSRKTALQQLTWDRVDFETGVVHLNVPGRRRTTKRRADVPISSTLLPILKRAHAERVNDYVLDHTGDVGPTVGYIAKRAKLAGVTPHVLRHTAATHMARRGVPLWLIAKVLGITLVVAEKVYAKHCPDDLREAVEKISRGRAAAPAWEQGSGAIPVLGAVSDQTKPTTTDNGTGISAETL